MERFFALIVGNNARKVHTTLRDIGDFSPNNMVLLEGSDAST